MDIFINFCFSMLRLWIASIKLLFEIMQYVWSNSELRQWICNSIAESPWPVYLIAFAVLSLGGGIALTKRERRQIWRVADIFCTVRDMSRWFRQK